MSCGEQEPWSLAWCFPSAPALLVGAEKTGCLIGSIASHDSLPGVQGTLFIAYRELHIFECVSAVWGSTVLLVALSLQMCNGCEKLWFWRMQQAGYSNGYRGLPAASNEQFWQRGEETYHWNLWSGQESKESSPWDLEVQGFISRGLVVV